MAEELSTSMDQSMEEEEDQEVVTLGELLESEQEMIDNADAVLGVLDDKKCTYSEGYMKRQALYSCLTCIPEARTDLTKVAGICLACCYYCHEGHDLVELYTKRNFRCDCGNSKFSGQTCNLDNSKSDVNELNEYNQNFSGVYCTCKRPYPDPDDTTEDEMIQCIICEDWLHSRHLGVTPIPSRETYSEMICELCVSKHKFLLHYDGLDVSKVAEEQNDVEIEEPPADVTQKAQNEAEALLTNGSGDNTAGTSCKMPKIKSEAVSAKFLPEIEWRQQLCTCRDCLKMYELEKVMFLTDSQDTLHMYEEKGKAKAREVAAQRQEDDMKLLNSLDRVPLMEAIAGYQDLKTNLMEYLKKFAENKKVVREEDIREFFTEFGSKKKQKCEIPHDCR